MSLDYTTFISDIIKNNIKNNDVNAFLFFINNIIEFNNNITSYTFQENEENDALKIVDVD
jgi:hypothetical protein